MKKIKNIILVSILTICAVTIVGIDKVNAATFDILNAKIVCEPDSLSAGQTTECYLTGKPDPATGEYSVNGYVTYAYATKYLKLVGAEKSDNISNVGAYFVRPESATVTVDTTGTDMPVGMHGYQCTYDSEGITASNVDFGCAIFYTVKDKANAYTPTSIKDNVDPDTIPTNNGAYGVIGSYVVTLESEIEENITECGELCVKAWMAPAAEDYKDVLNCAAGGKRADGTTDCGDATKLVTPGQGDTNYICDEIHYENHTNPDTGTFASYALLVAGALIAISAITLAKKNNKIYRV